MELKIENIHVGIVLQQIYVQLNSNNLNTDKPSVKLYNEPSKHGHFLHRSHDVTFLQRHFFFPSK